MTIALLVVVLAGMLSVLTPCILPLLPALLVVSDGAGRRRPWGIIVGVVTTFCAAILLLTWLVDLLGLSPNVLRYASAALLLAFGLVLLVPALDARFQRGTQALARMAPAGGRGDGFGSGLLAGSTLGFVWAPCAGPILAGVTSAVAREGLSREAVLLTAGYGVGMLVPLTGVVFGGRRLVGSLRRRLRGGRIAMRVMGAVLIATSALYFSGADTWLNRAIAENVALTSTPIAGLERNALDLIEGREQVQVDGCRDARELVASPALLRRLGYPEVDGPCNLGPAPDIEPGAAWINTSDGEPLTADDLRGNVVLVDVWTYSCINCLRTLPYLRAWHERYADDGLVIVGVHAPEFEFEKDLGNVRRAVRDLDVEWPVVLDNDFATWTNFHNRYWPAKYLIDRDGMLRYAHYGEGRYAETEQLIAELLDVDAAASSPEPEPNYSRTPETYLGYGRAERFSGVPQPPLPSGAPMARDREHRYEAPPELKQSRWALRGRWTVEEERSVAGPGAELVIRSNAADVFLVLGPAEEGQATPRDPVVVRDGSATRRVEVDGQRLYTLRDGDEPVDRTMRIEVPAGVAVYAFTFG